VSNSDKPTRILIVDDHPMVREGMAMRISMQEDLEICGEAATEEEAIALIEETHPDLMIVDLSLKCGHGLDVIKRTHKRHPSIKILVVSGFQESLYAERAIRAGAMGYLNKQHSHDAVIEAIRTVLRGERYLGPYLSQRLIAQALGTSDPSCAPIEQLTDRELEVFRMIGEGLTSGAIAIDLHLSTHTIDTHRENIKRKLGAKNAAELSRQAVQWVLESR
jgi:DNA-binding NarL/FixJ family response regulator